MYARQHRAVVARSFWSQVVPILRVLVLLLCLQDGAHSFGVVKTTRSASPTLSLPDPHHHRTTATTPKPGASRHALHNSFIIEDISGSSKDERSATVAAEVVLDAKGVPVTVGCIVRVCVEGLKAYQIARSGQGAFDPATGEFVPDTTSEPVGRRALILPVGISGIVTKVYDENGDVSANFPIQAKFVPGATYGSTYDPPSAFLMHFVSTEVEVVVNKEET